jgi:hypothetical protein
MTIYNLWSTQQKDVLWGCSLAKYKDGKHLSKKKDKYKRQQVSLMLIKTQRK